MLENLSDLFPTVGSLVIFICYMVFCVGQGIFVTASHKKGEGYAYNSVTVVLLTEIMKLFLAYFCYVKDNSLSSLLHGIRSNIKILCLYLVPSFLYCIYNNLAFINLAHFDPTTYFILLQLRVIITGVIFQIVFSKKLTKMQWFSLALLTFGCMIQQVDWDRVTSGESMKDHAFFSIYLLFIVIQTLCSCFAGVYNEHLLKETGGNVNVFIQNMFMYLDSILWNTVVLTFQGNLVSMFSEDSLRPILQPLVIVIILNNSLIGITTSFFLKSLNSILKTFASAMELLFTAVLSWVILGIEIKLNTVVAIFIVSYSLYIYSRNPVNNREKLVERTEQNDELRSKGIVSLRDSRNVGASEDEKLKNRCSDTAIWINHSNYRAGSDERVDACNSWQIFIE